MNLAQLKHFYVVDTETTGFSRSNADAIEVSALEVIQKNGKFQVVNEFDSYINPQYPLPPNIVEFNKKNGTGICDEFLADKPLAGIVAQDLYDFLGDNPILVGHNLPFDEKFIDKLYRENLGIPLETSESVDTLAICRAKMNNASNKLCDVHAKTKGRHSAEHPQFHNSLADCYATLDVLEHLKEKYYDKGYER